MRVTGDLGPATVRWVGGLFAACVLLQRFAVPGLPVALILPLILLGAAWGLVRGLAELNRTRRHRLADHNGGHGHRDRAPGPRPGSHLREPGVVGALHGGLVARDDPAGRSTSGDLHRRTPCRGRHHRGPGRGRSGDDATQYAGVPFRDWLADIRAQLVAPPELRHHLSGLLRLSHLPSQRLDRSGAFDGLAPDRVGDDRGAADRRPRLTIALLVVGLVVATSGSGVVLVVVALPILLASSARRQLARYLVPAAVVMVLGASSPMGQSILNRVGEGSTRQSSLSLRGASSPTSTCGRRGRGT